MLSVVVQAVKPVTNLQIKGQSGKLDPSLFPHEKEKGLAKVTLEM